MTDVEALGAITGLYIVTLVVGFTLLGLAYWRLRRQLEFLQWQIGGLHAHVLTLQPQPASPTGFTVQVDAPASQPPAQN